MKSKEMELDMIENKDGKQGNDIEAFESEVSKA